MGVSVADLDIGGEHHRYDVEVRDLRGALAKPLSVLDEKALNKRSHLEFLSPSDQTAPNANSIDQV
ncbi:hypothetical protein ACQZ5G_11215 [Agrobacterium sp. 22-214-1]